MILSESKTVKYAIKAIGKDPFSVVLSFLIPPIPTYNDILESGIEEWIFDAMQRNLLSTNNVLKWALVHDNNRLVQFCLQNGATNLDDALEFAYCKGDSTLVECILKYHPYPNMDYALKGACAGGHIDTVYQLLKDGGSNIQFAMEGVCMQSDNDNNMIRFIHEKSIGIYNRFWEYGMDSYYPMMELLSIHGLQSYRECLYQAMMNGYLSELEYINEQHLPYALNGACRGGHLELAKVFAERIGEHNILLQDAIYDTCLGGHIDVLNWLKSIRTLSLSAVNNGLEAACQNGKTNVIDWCIKHGATQFHKGVIGACRGGHLDVIRRMLDMGSPLIDLNTLMYNVCFGGHSHILHWITHTFLEIDALAWSNGLVGACRGGHYQLAHYTISRGAFYWNWALIGACRYGHVQLIREIIERDLDRETIEIAIRVSAHHHNFALIELLNHQHVPIR